MVSRTRSPPVVPVSSTVRYTIPMTKPFASLSLTLSVLTVLLLGLTNCSHFADKARDQEKAKIYLQLGADQFAQREYGKALESTLEALKYEPNYAAAYNHLGIIYMETKRYKKAEESYKKALELQQDYPEALNNYGVLLNRTDRFLEAIAKFERASAVEGYLTPENALTNIGFSYYKLGKISKAKDYHQKALDIVPEFCLAQKNLGDCYASEKNYKQAAEQFQRAATNCPLFEETRYKLGLAQMKLGNRQQAKATFEGLVSKYKSGPFVERSQEVLKLLH